jgi:hypothetical protein
MAPKRYLGILAAAAVLGVDAKMPADAEVVATALAHFASREDTSIGKEGLILLRPRTGNWTDQLLRGFSLRRGNDDCPLTSELYDRLVERNAVDAPVKELLRKSPGWRIARASEEKQNRLGFADKSEEGEPVRTIARISYPAWSVDGDTAFVMFFFRWSMHSAIAQYLIGRSSEGWSVKCSQLRFYP